MGADRRIHWRWTGKRVVISIVQNVIISPVGGDGDEVYNSLADTHRTVQMLPSPLIERTTSLVLVPGDIYIERSGVPTLFVSQLWDHDGMRSELEVARDAILEAPLNTVPSSAYRIAREVLPHAYGLFVALVRKERALLRGATTPTTVALDRLRQKEQEPDGEESP